MAGMYRNQLVFSHPIITILGCTGTGKSKLAIEIAKRFNGEIINADAMQIYQGLDIITNKVTKEEQDGIKHHVLGFWNPLKTLVVSNYKSFAFNAITDIISRKKLPIIVGGTFYYVESVLYDFVLGDIASKGDSGSSSDENEPPVEEIKGSYLPEKKLKVEDYSQLQAEFEKLENVELHERLKEVDPDMAEKTHPNWRRKILRALMVYYQFGKTLTSILEDQKSQPGSSSCGGPLKFTNALILLLNCDPTFLKERLDNRVDDMLNRGLLKELLDFYNKNGKSVTPIAEENHKGIFQSIGFKEFKEFLELEEEKRDTEEGQHLFKKGIELLKIATRQYARQQEKWLKNRFLKNSERQTPPIFMFDVTDLSKWDENVTKKVEEVVECHLTGKKPSMEPVQIEGKKVVVDKVYKCECGIFSNGREQYELHLNSNNHKRNMNKKKKIEEALAQMLESSEM